MKPQWFDVFERYTETNKDKVLLQNLLDPTDCGVTEVVVYGHCDGLLHNIVADNVAVEMLKI